MVVGGGVQVLAVQVFGGGDVLIVGWIRWGRAIMAGVCRRYFQIHLY